MSRPGPAMTAWAGQRIVTPSDVVARRLDDEFVLLNLNTESYFGLDAVGSRMWEILAAAPDLESAVQQLLGEYEVEEGTLRSDLEKLLTDLIDSGLVELRPI